MGYKAHGNISANAYINTKIDNAAESFPLYEKEINMPLSIADGSTLRSVSNVVMQLNNSYIWGTATDHFPANKSVGILGDGYIVVTGTIDPKDNATNNDACGVWAKASISFQ